MTRKPPPKPRRGGLKPMWGWRRAKLPLDLREKVWVELCFGWLIDRLGRDHLLATDCVTPSPEYFPRPFEPTPACAQDIFDRVCYFMRFEPGEVKLRTRLIPAQGGLPDDACPHDNGPHDDRSTVSVNMISDDSGDRFVARCTRALAHHRLDRLKTDGMNDAFAQFMGDLLPTLGGVGIFLANTVYETKRDRIGYITFDEYRRHGYLPTHVHGYALALRAWIRGETRPDWSRFLRSDVRAAVALGMHYLSSTRETLVPSGNRLAERAHLTQGALIQRISDGPPTEQLAALWQLQSGGQGLPEAALQPASRLLAATDRALRVESALALARTGRPTESAFHPLLDQLRAADGDARLSAALALGAMRLNPAMAAPELAAVVADDDDRRVVEAAAEGLRQYGRTDEQHAKAVLRRLWRAVATGRGADPMILAAALGAMVPDARALIVEERGEELDDVWDEVLALVEHAQDPPGAAIDDAASEDGEEPPMGAQGDYGLLPILVPTLSPRPTVSWMFA
jgi:hypothetical protein